MKSCYKRDAQKIWAFIDNLKQQPWLGDRRVWVDYLFHFTHLENAVNIIECGFLCSRVELENQNIAFSDSASSQVIQQTDLEFADQVRFYFRPLTPTTYHMEGFRPVGKRFHNAHCPVPVYLLFDIREVISHNETGFSNGNLASEYSSLFTSADDFARLPFADIYHEGPPHYEEKRYITRTKQAEVIYPKKISLDHLKYIYCRSQAEKDTLKNLLSTVLWQKWGAKVIVPRNPRELFQMHCLHVSEVVLARQSITFDLHPPTERAWFGPFSVKVTVTDGATHQVHILLQRRFVNIVKEMPGLRLTLDLSDIDLGFYTAKATIDGELAFLGQFNPLDEIPF